jgi:alanine racemase
MTKFSICNSASIIDKHFDDFDWVRPGIALYGVYPHERQRGLIALKPVLELKTRIIELKKLAAGSSVGYGATFVAKCDSRIGILPIGYADGYPRLISNRGFVLVRGERVPIVGRISMDLMAVDVSNVAGVCLYDEVTLIGGDGNQSIRVEEVALWAETISYEILTGMMPRVHREYA